MCYLMHFGWIVSVARATSREIELLMSPRLAGHSKFRRGVLSVKKSHSLRGCPEEYDLTQSSPGDYVRNDTEAGIST